MANEHSIRVSAKGEFGQLQRGLKQLQGDLKGVLGEIDKGARKGGIFDETSLRALSLYRDRFKTTLEDLNKEFEKQNRIIDRLHDKMKNASRREQEDLRKQINLREKELDVIRRQLFEAEKLYERRNQEAESYGTGGSGVGRSLGDKTVSNVFRSMLGGGKMLLGMAGIAGIGALAHQAYQGAYVARTYPMDLAQRMRGQGGWEGDSYNMWNRAYEIGTRNNMGYSTSETWDFLDQYSRQAGVLDGSQVEHLLGFGRAYGLNTSEVAQGISGVRELGGFEDPAHFADMIASSVEQSGMQARILEVMQTSAGLLANLNTSLKDTGAKQILAYQTTLDRIGNENGMMKLTGQQGANIISGLGGMFDPNNTDNKYMAMRALLQYDPEKYGNMDLFNLEMQAEDGLMNSDNLPAMVDYIRDKTGGNEQLFVRAMRRMLQSGGYSGTLRQIEELSNATNGFTAFGEENMSQVEQTLEEGDATAPYQERMTEIGQDLLDVNARFEKQLEELGQPILDIVTGLKEEVTGFAEWLTDNEDLAGKVGEILNFLEENWGTIATVTSIVALGGLLFKGLMAVGSIMAGVRTLLSGGDIDLPDGSKRKNKGSKGIPPWVVTAGSAFGFSSLMNMGLLGGYMGLEWASQGYTDWREDPDNPMKAILGDQTAVNKYLERDEAKKNIYDKWANGEEITDEEMKKAGIPITTEEDKKKAEEYLQGLQDSGELNLSELNKFGSGSLETLAINGSKDFGSFVDMSEQTFGDFYTLSESTLEDFYKMSTTNFNNLYKDGTGYLEDVYKEHKDFKGFFAGLWNEFMSEVSLGSGFGGGSLSAGSGYDVRTMSGITAKELDAKLGGKLSGYGAKFVAMGEKYGIDPAFLASVAMHETGNGTSNAIKSKNNVGGMMGKNGLMTFDTIGQGIEAMADNLKRLYIDDGLTTVEEIQKRYAPVGASNDPTGLNNHWTKGVYSFLNDFGIGGAGSMSGSSFWNGWQNRVTSEFGEREGFRSNPHSGLDIDGNQGDQLDALAGGIVKKVFYDDGGIYDRDGKKNSTSGGSTVMVQLPDGSQYAYAHMSKINPNLREGMKVNEGDWIGNIGGDKGVAGSGYSTTGSHLHLGYYDKYGNAIDPRKLLNQMSAGELDVNEMMNQGGYSLDMTNRSLGDVMRLATGQSPLGSQGSSASTVNVNLKIEGNGAEKLNYATHNQLRELVKQFMSEAERQRLAMNPTIAGWN